MAQPQSISSQASIPNDVRSQKKQVKRLPILFSLVIGLFFAILNNTLLNVAYSELTRAFKITETTVQWLTTSYMLIVGILVPISALLMQWFTTRQMFLGAMAFFTTGTLVCAMAPGFEILLVGRMIQAAGTGLLMPVMMNTVLLLFPHENRGSAMGMIGLVIMFAPAIGPALSGVIVDHLSWRWLFLIVLPFSVFSMIFAAIYLENVSEVTKPKFDLLSVVLSTAGFGGLVFGFSSLGQGNVGWASPEIYLSFLISIVALVWFIIRQLRLEEPILELRVFKYPMFSLATVLAVILMMSMYAMMIILPLLLQNSLLLSASVAGLVLLPGGMINGLVSPVAGRLFDRFGPRVLVIPGTIIIVSVMVIMTQISLSTPVVLLIVLHSSFMFGVAMIMMPSQTNGLNQLPRRYYPHGTAVTNTLMQVSGAIGIALFLGIMAARQARYTGGDMDPSALQSPEAVLAGVQGAFTLGLVLAVIGFVSALFIKRTYEREQNAKET